LQTTVCYPHNLFDRYAFVVRLFYLPLSLLFLKFTPGRASNS
jgi:hypothetical protein